jgi:adenylate kinase family enzyme
MAGSIKGALVELIVKEKGIKHVSPGEALRDAIKNKTAAGIYIFIYIYIHIS